MGIHSQDDVLEQNEKTMKTLREGWQSVRTGKTVLTEGTIKPGKVKTAKELGKDGKSRGDTLLKDRGVEPMKEEETEKTKADDVVAADAVTPEVPPVADGAADAVTPEVPPVADAVAPVGLQPDQQKQLATQQFVQAALKGVQSGDADNKNLVTEYGFFKADVNDPANGQFVVVAYPVGMKLKDIAAIVEPDATPADAVAAADALAPETAETPVEGSPADAVQDAAAGGEGAEEEQDAEALAESVRDPMVIGKKNWKAYIQNLLVESKQNLKKKLEKVEESKEKEELKEESSKGAPLLGNAHLAQLEKELAAAKSKDDKEEVAELEKEIAKHKEEQKSKKAKEETDKINKKSAEKDKDDIKNIMKTKKED